jgi:hypothetical protein
MTGKWDTSDYTSTIYIRLFSNSGIKEFFFHLTSVKEQGYLANELEVPKVGCHHKWKIRFWSMGANILWRI